MDFKSLFEKVQDGLSGVNSTKIDPDFAVQVNVTGEAAGAFYIANKGGIFRVEPYDYKDRDGAVTLSGDLLIKLIDGTAAVELELAKGKIKIEGNPGALLKVFNEAKKTAKAEKKTAKAEAKAAKPEVKAAKPELKADKAAKPEVKAEVKAKPEAKSDKAVKPEVKGKK